MTNHRGVYPTDAGSHCLWDAEAFAEVTDYPSWEREFLEDADIARHVAAGHLVPINMQSDGAMEIEVRVGTSDAPAAITDRESKYLIAHSQSYRFLCSGRAHVCGIEYVETPAQEGVGILALPRGDYAATVHLIAWDEEPGAVDSKGHPAPDVLPDYLVLLNPVTGKEQFRTKILTFDQPH